MRQKKNNNKVGLIHENYEKHKINKHLHVNYA